MRIGDESDAVYTQILGEYPGDDIIGMSALGLRQLAESDPAFPGWMNMGNELGNNQTVRAYMDNRQYREIPMVVRAKIDRQANERGITNDENKIRFYIIRVLPYAHKEQFQAYADKLQ